MLKIYLDEDSDALDGFEFLTMAEAGEVGHWEVLQQMSAHAGHAGVDELVRVGPADPAAALRGRARRLEDARGE